MSKQHNKRHRSNSPIVSEKYAQVANILREDIRTGKYRHGEKLPGIQELKDNFGVSVNVVVEAIKQLKSEKLVTATPRKGIFCNINPEKTDLDSSAGAKEDKNVFTGTTFSFPHFVMRKELSIWIEDYLPWQQNFWHSIFREFSESNPEIKILPYWGRQNEIDTKSIDLAIGGIHFMHKANLLWEDLLSRKELEAFIDFENIYSGKFIKPSDCAWKGEEKLFPWAFYSPIIISGNSSFKNNHPFSKGIVSFFKMILNSGEDTLYNMWSPFNSLVSAGCQFLNPSKGVFELNNDSNWEEVLAVFREAYAKKRLAWQPDFPRDAAFLSEGISKKNQFMEMDIRQLLKLDMDNLNIYEIPCTTFAQFTPVNFYITNKTSFPEESGRLLSFLLSADMQCRILKAHMATPITASAYKDTKLNCLAVGMEKARHKILLEPPDSKIYSAIGQVLFWELYHYIINGKTKNFTSRVNAKINFMLKETVKEKISLECL